MKLSEAIRLGSMITLPGFGQLRLVVTSYEGGAFVDAVLTCALGAAREAGFPVHEADMGYGALANDNARPDRMCPACDEWPPLHAYSFMNGGIERVEPRTLARLIQHLNDDHRWTREAIADFVEAHEEQDAPTAPETVLAHC